MKTPYRIILCVLLVFPLFIIGQQTSPNSINCHAGFKADVTYTCSSSLLVHFTDQSVIPEGHSVSKWTWIFGDGQTSNDSKPSHNYAKPGIYSVKLIIQTDLGWADSLIRENYIKVTGKLDVDLGNDTSICEGSTLQLNAGNPGATYFWNTGASTQQITITEPGEYWVIVKKENCESRDLIVIGSNPPAFPNFGFSLEGTCLPLNVKFSDSSTSCGTNSISRWWWDFGDGTSSSLQHPEHIYTSNDTFLVRLTIWDRNGFSVTRSKRVVINAIQGPMVNLGRDTSVCEIEPLVLDAGNPDATFTWSTGDIYQSCVITNSGQVWVRVEQNGCIASDTVMVTVTPTMNPSFGFNIQQGLCPAPVKFTDSSQTCGVEIMQWSWDFGDSTVSSDQHPQHAYQQSGEYIVRMTVFDNLGNSVTKSKRLVIGAGTLVLNLGKDTTICFGESLLLNAGSVAASYIWSTGETTREINVQDDGDYWVRVDNGGCIGYDTINVKTVFPISPSFAYNIKGNCLPVELALEDKSETKCGQQIVQWRWDFGDGATSQEQNPRHAYNRSDTFAIRLTVVTDRGMSISKSRKVFIENKIPIINAGNDLTICKDESVQLDAGLDSAVYLWTPETSLDNRSIRRPVAHPSETTTYLVAATKCMTTVTDQVVVFVKTPDQPIIITDGKGLISSKAKGYQWWKNNEIIHGANQRVYEPKGAGFYSVRVKNENGCQAVSQRFFYLPESKKERWVHGIRVRCTPNPSTGLVYILLSHLPERPVSVRVIDRFGQPFNVTTINNYSNLLNLSNLAKGYYLVELILGKEKVSIPLLIQ